MKIYVTSDTHFNHENIIKYCKRPYENANKMNESLIKNWNKVVKKEDTIFHLGDFGFGTKEELKSIFNRLNGKKYLIMGNHDFRVGKKYYEELGFIKVYKKSFEIDKYILSHKPITTDKFNIYGHIHDKPESKEYLDGKHVCVCVDKTNFTPSLLIDAKIDIKKL